MAEIVYVLTNESMEGMVKIGRTSTSVEQRIRELDKQACLCPFNASTLLTCDRWILME